MREALPTRSGNRFEQYHAYLADRMVLFELIKVFLRDVLRVHYRTVDLFMCSRVVKIYFKYFK